MTKDEIIKLAREAGLFTHKDVQPEILAFANLVAKHEREACAKVCEVQGDYDWQQYADAIRARGNT